MGQTKVADVKPLNKHYYVEPEEIRIAADPVVQYMGKNDLEQLIKETQTKMEKAAKELDFMEAARLRDELFQLPGTAQKRIENGWLAGVDVILSLTFASLLPDCGHSSPLRGPLLLIIFIEHQ